MMKGAILDDVAGAIGRGLLSGLAGTAAMTLLQTLEMKLSGRSGSDTPARAVGKTLRIQPRDPVGRQRLTQAVHWSYGTGWGLMRAALQGVGLRGWPATVAHLGAVWGSALVTLPRMDLAPPVRRWGWKTLATDFGHHAVYAAAAGFVYDALEQQARDTDPMPWSRWWNTGSLR